MDYSPSRHLKSSQQQHFSSSHSEMAMLAAPSAAHSAFAWDSSRVSSFPSRSSEDDGPVSLPSIRMAFPELLQLPKSQESSAAFPAPEISPRSTTAGNLASPSYVHSPVTHKRRRDSIDEEQDGDRARQVPRVYYSPDRTAFRLQSPGYQTHPSDHWAQSSRKSSFSHREPVPPPMEVHDRVEPRHTLPRLSSSLSLERNPGPRPLTRDRYEDYPERHHHHQRTGSLQQGLPPMDTAAARYASSSFEFGQRRASHIHSMSASPIHSSYDRTPFSAGAYSRPFPDYPRYSDLGHIGLSGDGKQRKRRGNLPKETTDKLRSWFMAHLSHPYPTEDEKQELMRQTGLQMNQISNWFINARRRQLPTMINNARAETDAMSNRTGEGKILPTTERHELVGKHTLNLSDGETSAYDDELKAFQRQRAPALKRGSV